MAGTGRTLTLTVALADDPAPLTVSVAVQVWGAPSASVPPIVNVTVWLAVPDPSVMLRLGTGAWSPMRLAVPCGVPSVPVTVWVPMVGMVHVAPVQLPSGETPNVAAEVTSP